MPSWTRCTLTGCTHQPAVGSSRCDKHKDTRMTIVRYYTRPHDAQADAEALERFGIPALVTDTTVEAPDGGYHTEYEVAAAIPNQRDALANILNPDIDEHDRGMSKLWDED